MRKAENISRPQIIINKPLEKGIMYAILITIIIGSVHNIWPEKNCKNIDNGKITLQNTKHTESQYNSKTKIR